MVVVVGVVVLQQIEGWLNVHGCQFVCGPVHEHAHWCVVVMSVRMMMMMMMVMNIVVVVLCVKGCRQSQRQILLTSISCWRLLVLGEKKREKK